MVKDCFFDITSEGLARQYVTARSGLTTHSSYGILLINTGLAMFIMLYVALLYYHLTVRQRPWGTPSEVLQERNVLLDGWFATHPSFENAIAANLATIW